MFGKGPEEETDDFKKRRDAETEKIRRSNRDEIFSKRRNILLGESNNSAALDQEQFKKERILIVDERYRKELEKYLPAYLVSSEPPTPWMALAISLPPSENKMSYASTMG